MSGVFFTLLNWMSSNHDGDKIEVKSGQFQPLISGNHSGHPKPKFEPLFSGPGVCNKVPSLVRFFFLLGGLRVDRYHVFVHTFFWFHSEKGTNKGIIIYI